MSIFVSEKEQAMWNELFDLHEKALVFGDALPYTPPSTDPYYHTKPQMIRYDGKQYMCKPIAGYWLPFNYMENTYGPPVCKVGEESESRGCSGFDF